MPHLDFVTYIQYHNWANERLMETAVQVPRPKLYSKLKQSKNTAFEILRHMLDVQWSWRVAAEGQPVNQLLWEVEPLEDLQSVRDFWQLDGSRLLAFVQSLSEDDFERQMQPSWSERSYPIRYMLLHLINHATNHRSEVGWYFTKLGFSPGDLEFMNYIDNLNKE